MRWLVVALILAGLSVGAAAHPTVFVSPSYVEVVEGEPFTLGIRVDAGVDTVTCFLVDFTFDADVVGLVSADEGTLFSDCGYETMFDWDILGAGQHSCNDVTLGHWAYAICPGELVHLSFVAESWGTTAVQITAVDLRDIDREPILPVDTMDATVAVAPSTGVDGDIDTDGLRVLATPNPFVGSVTLTLGAGSSGTADELVIYDASGRLVRRWAGSVQGRLPDAVVWDGRGSDGRACPGGVYFAVARCRDIERRGTVVLVR